MPDASTAAAYAAGSKQAGVEEIGAGASRFELEFSKPEHAAFQGEFDELSLIGFHGLYSR